MFHRLFHRFLACVLGVMPLLAVAASLVTFSSHPGALARMAVDGFPALSLPAQMNPPTTLQVPMQVTAGAPSAMSPCQQRPSAQQCSGVLPTDAGCVQDAQDLLSVFFFHHGAVVGWARTRFSPSCSTIWVKAVGYQASGIAGVSIDAHLPSDQPVGTLHSDSAGQDDQQGPLQVFSTMIYRPAAQHTGVQMTVTLFFTDGTSQAHVLQ